MDVNTKVRDEWVLNHLTPNSYICLVDLSSDKKKQRLVCKVLDLSYSRRKPVWLHLKLLIPETYPNRPGELVDSVENCKDEIRLHCSFRDLLSMMRHIFFLQPIIHLPNSVVGVQKTQILTSDEIQKLLDIAESVSSLMILECSILHPCSKGHKCTNHTITHLIRYKH